MPWKTQRNRAKRAREDQLPCYRVLFQQVMDVGDDPQRDVVDGQLVVAGAQGAALFEPTHHSLDEVPLAVTGLVEPLFARLVLAGRDHRLDVVPPQPSADAGVT